MHPTLFTIGRFAVPSHEAFVGLGVAAAAVVFFAEARRRGVAGDERLLWVVAGALLGGALGAKLSTAWRYVAVTGDASFAGVMVRGGRSVLGGLAGAYAGAVLAKRLVDYRRRTGDLFAPAVALGMAVGRVGCLLSEPPGTPTGGAWGVRLTAAEAARTPGCPAWCAAGRPLHPSFAYEVAFHLLAFAVLWATRRRPAPDGARWAWYLLAYAVFRFGVEFVRGNDVVWHGLTRGQLFLLAAGPGLAWRAWRMATPAPRPASFGVARA
ncbi:diacylglyceryl transferase [Gemmatimonadetes bacterium T265]|nr:diacylglyceryl transferase [Gemmatimonadetes bacterium T265]